MQPECNTAWPEIPRHLNNRQLPSEVSALQLVLIALALDLVGKILAHRVEVLGVPGEKYLLLQMLLPLKRK